MFILNVAKALDQQGVAYAIVGGLAVTLHGAQRATFDLDISVKLSKKELQRAESVFKSLGLNSRLPVTAEDVFHFRDEYIKKRNLVAWGFYNPHNPMEVLNVIITHDLAKMKTVEIKAFGCPLSVLALRDLIQMKKSSGRPQDLADIEALEYLMKGRTK